RHIPNELGATINCSVRAIEAVSSVGESVMALTVLDSVAIDSGGTGARTLMLCQGDLAQMSSQDAVNFIAVSALPGDYTPSSGSLIGALAQAGVSVQQQSQNKAANYEPTMPCWVSQDVTSAGLNFNRCILFELA